MVKKGSKAWATTSGVMPVPVSVTAKRTYRPSGNSCSFSLGKSTLRVFVALEELAHVDGDWWVRDQHQGSSLGRQSR